MEVLAIIFVFIVAAISFVVAWIGAKDPKNAPVALDQLKQYRETLQQDALRGQRESWDDVMMEHITTRLSEVEQRITETASRLVEAKSK